MVSFRQFGDSLAIRNQIKPNKWTHTRSLIHIRDITNHPQCFVENRISSIRGPFLATGRRSPKHNCLRLRPAPYRPREINCLRGPSNRSKCMRNSHFNTCIPKLQSTDYNLGASEK